MVPFPVSTRHELFCSLVFVDPGGFSLRIGVLKFRPKDALRDWGSHRKKRGHKHAQALDQL